MNAPSRGGRLKEGGVYLLFLICMGAFKKRRAFIRGFTVLLLYSFKLLLIDLKQYLKLFCQLTVYELQQLRQSYCSIIPIKS